MKTRNNQSHADETLLNQSITRRSFVKRSAVASAATVFGLTTTAFSIPTEVGYSASMSLGTTVYISGATLSTNVADPLAQHEQIMDWATKPIPADHIQPGGGPVNKTVWPWEKTRIDTRTHEFYALDEPIMWVSAGGSMVMIPAQAGGFNLWIGANSGITIEIQTHGVRPKQN